MAFARDELNVNSDVSVNDARVQAVRAHIKLALHHGVDPVHVPEKVLDRDSKISASNTKAYLKDILFNADAVSQLKVLVVGPAAVGKTSLTRALQGKGLKADLTPSNSDERATIGVEVHRVELSKKTVGAVGSLMGRKARDGGEVSLWDFGGQEEYYMTHALFLSDRSLVMVVVDLSAYEDTDDSFEECAGQWLRALHVQLYRPQVVVVGTKCDLVSATDTQRKMEQIMGRIQALGARVSSAVDAFSKGSACFEGLQFSDPSHFVVSGKDVKTGDGVVNLYKFLRDLACEPAKGVALKVPKTFEDIRGVLVEYRKAGRNLVRLDELRAKAGVKHEDDATLRLALSLLHDLGVVLWYEHSVELNDVVLTKPEWVVDLVRSVFRHDLFERRETGKAKAGTLYDLKSPRADVPLQELQARLKDQCLLDRRLLELFPLWKDLDAGEFALCVQLLRQFELVFDIPRASAEDPVQFMVPMFLRRGFVGSKSDGERKVAHPGRKPSSFIKSARASWRKSMSKATQVTLRFEFYAFIPHGLFLRFVARSFRLAQYETLAESLVEAVYEPSAKDQQPVHVTLTEARDGDGAGRVDVRCAVHSSKAEDVRNVQRTFQLFVKEMDDLLSESFRVVPFERVVLSKDGKTAALLRDVVDAEEKNESQVKLFDASQSCLRPERSRRGTISAESKDVVKSLQALMRGAKIREQRLKHDIYTVKEAVHDALKHQQDAKGKATVEVVAVAMAQLKLLCVHQGVDLDDAAVKFPLHEADTAMRETLRAMLDRDVDEFADRATAESLCLDVRRLSTRLRTAFDAFMSHSWGEGQKTHAFVLDIAAELHAAHGIACWTDEKQMKGNVVVSMSAGIDQSQVFCVCLTPDYGDKVRNDKQNGNCGKEYFYAEEQQRAEDMLPLLLDAEMRDKAERKGMMKISGALWVELKDEADVAANIATVAAKIRERLFPHDDEAEREQLLSMYPSKHM